MPLEGGSGLHSQAYTELPSAHISVRRDAEDGGEAQAYLRVRKDPAVIRSPVVVASEIEPARWQVTK